MSDRAHDGRPPGVTIVVVLTALMAVLDVVAGVLVLVGRAQGGSIDDLTPEQAADVALVVGIVLLVLGVLQAFLAVRLAQRSNGARLVLTLVLAAQLAHAWVLVSGRRDGLVQGFAGLAVTLVILALVWSPSASGWFTSDRDQAMSTSLERTSFGVRPSLRARVLDFLLRLVVLGGTIALAPGISVSTRGSLLLAVVMITLAGWVLQPVFLKVALLFGWFGAVMLALFANAAVIGVGLYVTPGIEVSSVLSAVVASWIYAFVMTLVTWAFSINGRDYLTVHAMRMGARGAHEPKSDIPGIIFVQLDGVPAPLLENEIRAGNIPTISRWVRSGSHTWTEWTARVPSTTPVSQAGLLHGSNDGIPAFRWFDRELGRLVVANKPEDAAVIESRLSTGHGLLADDGVSISNLFSGDAPISLLTMSGLKERARGLGPSQSYAAFFTHPAGILRAVILTSARWSRRCSRPGARCGAGSSRASTAGAPTSSCAR